MTPTAKLVGTPTIQLTLSLEQAQALHRVLIWVDDNPHTDPVMHALATLQIVTENNPMSISHNDEAGTLRVTKDKDPE